jgi:hypothetical protein
MYIDQCHFGPWLSVTVNNGAKYMSCKIPVKFSKNVGCIQGDSDHEEIVEAVDGGWCELTRINLAFKHVYVTS